MLIQRVLTLLLYIKGPLTFSNQLYFIHSSEISLISLSFFFFFWKRERRKVNEKQSNKEMLIYSGWRFSFEMIAMICPFSRDWWWWCTHDSWLALVVEEILSIETSFWNETKKRLPSKGGNNIWKIKSNQNQPKGGDGDSREDSERVWVWGEKVLSTKSRWGNDENSWKPCKNKVENVS